MIIDTGAAKKLIDKYFKNLVMKRNDTELDVDFIGGQGSLTEEEEKLISEYIKANKAENLKLETDRKRRITNKTVKKTEANVV